jgi:hypothetical protein
MTVTTKLSLTMSRFYRTRADVTLNAVNSAVLDCPTACSSRTMPHWNQIRVAMRYLIKVK